MRQHIEDYWFGYVMIALAAWLIAILVNSATREQRQVNYCFDRGMVLVDTTAGKRCAFIDALNPVNVK